ncbi:hypothetical protein Bca101_026232 [Brassica carinata]
MVSQSNLIRHGGSSSAVKRRLDLEEEDEIIQIPACDLSAVAERFKRTLIVPVHYWNDGTFGEISKALGKLEDTDAPNARLQVSVDANKPLKFERRIGFQNGDTGKVYLEYEGLIRYCFACKRISHDIYACPDISQEEREQKIKEYRELNGMGAYQNQTRGGLLLSNRSNPANNNKRPRSPNGEGYSRSPARSHVPGFSRGAKRNKESEKPWSPKRYGDLRNALRKSERQRDDTLDRKYKPHDAVWKRLEKQSDRNYPQQRESEELNGRSKFSKGHYRQRDLEGNRAKDRYPATRSQQSQQVWRVRNSPKETENNSRLKSVAISKNQRASPLQHMDSQQTVSGIPEREGNGGQGHGVLVLHKNETSEEKLRRLKGKAHVVDDAQEKTPMSAAKNAPLALITRDRGTIVIREDGTRNPGGESRYVPSVGRPSIGNGSDELELDNLMESDQIKNMDEPGFDAEKIDAISQLSPASAVYSEEMRERPEEKKKQDASLPVVATKPSKINNSGKKQRAGDAQGTSKKRTNQPTGPGVAGNQKRAPLSPDFKGARASKKFNPIRGRPYPKKPKGSGGDDTGDSRGDYVTQKCIKAIVSYFEEARIEEVETCS